MFLVFDAANAARASFDVSSHERIEPVPIHNGLFVLTEELAGRVLAHDGSIVFETREVAPEEWIGED